MATLDAAPANDDETTATGTDETPHPADRATTTVEVRATGKVRDALPSHSLSFTFEGGTLRAFLDAFFAEYEVADLLLAETDADATTRGWADAPEPDALRGTWYRNPEGEQTRTYARICVNGRFNETLDGLDTELADGDRVALINPFLYCV
ncbi:MoaD/ThiS family protein [Salinirubrum litoreum]|uniref:MoaD/ThiS family protein n=1 Tax=Salinirubrum litoreum TaxID=1126234 RepID=A0ABD5RCK4_9EURY|nr:MoaD/ThiS family protein [Salinirubrum litoreum]